MRVADIPEDALISRLTQFLPQGRALVPTGDDAAVIPFTDPRGVLAADVLVEGVHFRRQWSSGADVGWRAIMQNAADICAMGGFPTAFLASVVLPGSLEVSWVEDLARGMGEACNAVERQVGAPCGVVGGDLSGGQQVVVSIGVIGELAGPVPLERSGARPGDVIAHAGNLGHAAAGYAALQAGLSGARGIAGEPGAGRESACSRAVASFLRPHPPLARALAAARGGARALMDVSDGLVRDAGRMATASKVRINLRGPGVLADSLVCEVARQCGVAPADWALGGGEDHGFLAAFPPGSALPEGFRAVGRAEAARGGAVVLVEGSAPQVKGWDHFGG